MFKKTKICSRLLVAFGTMLAAGAQAQDAAAPDVQRVEITGSSIKRIATEGALPIQTITSDDIRKSGVTTVTDLIQNLPAMQGFTSASQSVNGEGNGVTTASLHDLGSQYTLVLLNGRRIAPWSSSSDVNLNSIPLSAIERVEVLTDGASALYGSDAIAGVVNFITKKDSTAGAFSLSAYKPQHAGGKSGSASISKGFGDLDKDKFNVLFAASFDVQQKLMASQRSFSRSGVLKFQDQGASQEVDLLSSYATPGNASVLLSNGSTVTINPSKISTGACAADNVASTSGTAGTTGYVDRCTYDYASTVEALPASRRANLYSSGRVVLSDKVSLFSELALSHFETDAQYAAPAQELVIPQSLLTKDIDPLLAGLGYGSATSVAGTDSTMYLRLIDAGGRRDRYETDAVHAVLGADAQIGNVDATFSYTHSTNRQLDIAEGGYLSTNALDALVDSGAYDPLAPSTAAGASALASAVLHQNLDTQRSTIDALSAHGSTTLGKLPGGDLGLGFGLDLMHQKFSDSPSAIEQGTNALQPDYTDAITGGNGGALPLDSSRNSWGVFGEVNAPVSRIFEFDASARFDSASAVKNKDDFDADGDPIGAATQGRKESAGTFKLSALLHPSSDFLVRGSIGTGFKVPSMKDITSPLQAYGVTGMHDCPVGLSAEKAAYCKSYSYEYNVQEGGNPDTGAGALKPEHSTQWTLGARFEPSQAFSLGVDLWTVRLRDQINTITEDTAFANAAAYDALFKIANDPISGVPTLTFLEVPINTGAAFYQGLDLDGESRVNTPFGRLTTKGHMTYMLRADYQEPGQGGYVNDMSRIGPDGQVTFRWQANVTVSLEAGKFTHTLGANFKPGYMDDTEDYCRTDSAGDCLTTSAGDTVGRHVSSYATFDWQTRYDVSKALSVTMGLKNVFDRNPPFSLIDQAAVGNVRGYDSRYADPIGRQLYMNATYAF